MWKSGGLVLLLGLGFVPPTAGRKTRLRLCRIITDPSLTMLTLW